MFFSACLPRRASSCARYRLDGATGVPCESIVPSGSGGPEPNGRGDCFRLADAADQPVVHAGRVLHEVIVRRAVPDHAPAHRPPVPGAHRPAVAHLHPAADRAAVVVEQAGRPALVRFRFSVAAEGAVEDDDRPGDVRRRSRRARRCRRSPCSGRAAPASVRARTPRAWSAPWCFALRLMCTFCSVIRRPPTETLFIVSSIWRLRTQQSSPLKRMAV